MTEKDLREIIELAEQGRIQFKERAMDKYDIACEMCAFCNSKGGRLIVGVKDKSGELNPLSYNELQETTNRLSLIAKDGVVPSITISIENVKVDGGAVVVAEIPQGHSKPYHDTKGVVWI